MYIYIYVFFIIVMLHRHFHYNVVLSGLRHEGPQGSGTVGGSGSAKSGSLYSKIQVMSPY